MTDTTTVAPTQEHKEQAAAALVPFLDKSIEMVITPTVHVFLQADGLHMVFNGGEKLAYLLNGKMYTLAMYSPTSPARTANAFILAAIQTVKRAFKITEEFTESDFYFDYSIHLAQYSQEVEKHISETFDKNVSENFPSGNKFGDAEEDIKEYGSTASKSNDLAQSIINATDADYVEFLKWKKEKKAVPATDENIPDAGTEKKVAKLPPALNVTAPVDVTDILNKKSESKSNKPHSRKSTGKKTAKRK